MKILMVNVVCGIRSTGRICTDLAIALEAQGHEVKIAYGREKVPEQFQRYAIHIGTDLDVKLHGLRARLLDGAGFGSKRTTEMFIEWIKEYDPDVIHLHNIHGYYINVVVLFNYLKTCGKKVIWTLHDCWAFTGHTAYCDIVHCMRWKNGCHDCPLKNEYPKSMVDGSKNNWKKKRSVIAGVPNLEVITPSEWLASWVKESFMKDYPVNVIHNGINTSTFQHRKSDFREKNHLECKCLLLGVATSWDDNKGLKDYIELSNRLKDSYKVVLVGLTKEQVRTLPDNIVKITRTNNVFELVEIYSACDYFINLSYCENYPTVNLEAIACGTPVITYDTGGSKESVLPGCGYVVEQGDLARVVDLLDSEHLVISSDIFERSVIDSTYMVASYLKLYGEVI